MWLRRWLGVIVAWVVGVALAGAVFLTPDKYEASARIFVDTDSVLKPLLAGLVVQANTEQQIGMLSRTLISRPNIEKLVRMADLDLGIKSTKDKDALIDDLMKTLKIKGVGRDNLYTIEYRDSNPEKARKVVQSLTTIFIESSLGGKQSDADTAIKFVEEQIKVYQKKLEEAEARLKDFKLKNIELNLDSDKGSTVRISEIGNQLNQARLELREAENSRDAIKREMTGESPVLLPDTPGTESSVSIPEIDGRIESQKRELDAVLKRFTEQHPDVISARRLIKELEEQKRQEIAVRKKAAIANPAAASPNSNPAYQQMKVSLTESEATIASLRVRVAEYESRYKRGVESMKLAPQVEAEFAQLNRDYEIHRKNYNDLVQRREGAGMSESMAAVSGVADFRLIDPPRASSKPVSPDRPLLLPLALLVALAAGLAASFAASQLRPVFFDSHTLRDVTGLPLLGVISMPVTPASQVQARKSRIRIGAALGSLVGFYGLAMLAIFLFLRQA
ncbi:MAG: chain length-determining protein [Sulfuritalea sp.]|nr:chain length-determining protein [Sulfuritalea sp.]